VILADYPHLPRNEDTQTRYVRLLADRTSLPAEIATLDDHALWEGTPASREARRLAIQHSVREAARALGDTEWSQLPAALREMVARTYGQSQGTDLQALLGTAEPCTDWRGVLRHVIPSTLGIAVRFDRPPRRYPHLVGVVPARVHAAERPRLLIVVDTSGSIDRSTLEHVAAELTAMARSADVTVAECDVAIRAVYALLSPLRTVTGRGGTDLRPPFDTAFLGQHRPDAVVYFTDGVGPAPKRPPGMPVFWCLTANGRRPASWGRVLRARI
jgi:predicted metal-dependent peptidase